MPTPSIQTLTTDAQQVLNLDSISAVRSVVAVALANANTGTPLNPNLTTQQLWDQFYQVVTRPKSDIESIIANQLMKFLYSPPAPGGAGADKQVIFNDGGVLAGDPQFLWDKTTNLLTVTGAATITGNLKVGTTSNQGQLTVGVGSGLQVGTTTSVAHALYDINYAPTGDINTRLSFVNSNGATNAAIDRIGNPYFNDSGNIAFLTQSGAGSLTERYRIAADGVATWSNVGGVAGTAMTLNSTGLGLGETAVNGIKLLSAVTTAGMPATSGTTQSAGSLRLTATNTTGCLDIGTAGAVSWLQACRRTNLADNFDLALNPNGGNVGIGVTPSAWASGLKALQVANTGSYWFGGGTVWSASSYNYFGNNGYNDGSNWLYARAYGAAQYEQYNNEHRWKVSTNSPSAGGTITFLQAMTLDASGNLLVGSALPVSGGRISGNSSTGPAGRFFSSAGDNQFAAMFDKSSATNTTSQWFIGFTINNQSTGSGQINANGASQAAFGTFSDSRLKENIVSLPSQLANILSLRPVEFDYKDGSGHQIGFVAQEMQEVYSDTVSEQNGFLTVTGWSKTEARLVSAMKELAAKVQVLEAKLA